MPIIRPKSFVGPERLGVFALFYDWAKDGKNFPMLGSGKNRYQLLDVEDLCAAIYLAAPSIPQGERHLQHRREEFTTMKEDYQAVLDAAGKGSKIVAPRRARDLDAAHPGGAAPLAALQWVYETAAKDSFVSIEKAERVLGYRPQLLEQARPWCATTTGTSRISTSSSTPRASRHRVPWKQGILKLAKVFF